MWLAGAGKLQVRRCVSAIPWAILCLPAICFFLAATSVNAQNKIPSSEITDIAAPEPIGQTRKGPLIKNSVRIDKTVLAPLASVGSTQIDFIVQPSPVVINGLHSVQVTVRNHTDRPVIVEGSAAVATVGGDSYRCAPVTALEPKKVPREDLVGKIKSDTKATVTAAATIGVWQSVHDQLQMSGPIPKRYGWDEKRRSNELSAFERRILWPGDSTQGLMFFDSDQLDKAELVVPVESQYDKADRIELRHRGS